MFSSTFVPRIADDDDFQQMKKLIDEHTGWDLELNKSCTKVYTRPIPKCDFNMVKILSHFDDCSSDILFDVLHDPDYRKEWDSHMLASEEIGIVNVNNDVGYYAMSCPTPLKPRDFVLLRSWLDTGPRGEQMVISRSVPHKDFPPRKGYVRAHSHITGFIIRSLPQGGCFLGYVAQCDPKGHLPSWLVNKVTHTLGPRMINDLRKASLGYINWKRKQINGKKPWRFPEEISVPRIILEKDCIDTTFASATSTNNISELGFNRSLNTPITPQQNKLVLPTIANKRSISAPTTPMHEQLLLNSPNANLKITEKNLNKIICNKSDVNDKLTNDKTIEDKTLDDIDKEFETKQSSKQNGGIFKTGFFSLRKKKKLFGKKKN